MNDITKIYNAKAAKENMLFLWLSIYKQTDVYTQKIETLITPLWNYRLRSVYNFFCAKNEVFIIFVFDKLLLLILCKTAV